MYNGLIKEYTKQPIKIQAVLYDGSSDSIKAILELNKNRYIYFFIGEHLLDEQELQNALDNNKKIHFYIRTSKGNKDVNIGDYVIKTIDEEIYPCKPDIFNKTYLPVMFVY